MLSPGQALCGDAERDREGGLPADLHRAAGGTWERTPSTSSGQAATSPTGNSAGQVGQYTHVLGRPLVGTDPDGHCYPICTVLAGALIGGVVGGGAYALAMAISGQEIRADPMLVAAAGGAVAGSLIGTGLMIAGTAAAAGLSASAATAAGEIWVAADTGAAAYAGGYLASLNGKTCAWTGTR